MPRRTVRTLARSATLAAASCLLLAGTASDCWAVGEYGTFSGQHRTFAAHWDGSTWSQVSTPNPGGGTGRGCWPR